MVNIIENNSPDFSNENLYDKKENTLIRSTSISQDIFDFIGDWILKDFLEHEAG